MSEEIISNAESRGCRGQGDGKDPARLDTGAASWPLPKARAGYRDCGSHGSSSDRSPRSPRTSGDVPTWTHATDKLRRSRYLARLLLTRGRRGSVLEDRSVP